MEICRLCFNSTWNIFIPLNIEDGSIQRKQLEVIFPEIDLNVILSPVLCWNCSNTLENVYLLRNIWLECEGKLKNYLESKPDLKNPNLFDVIKEDNKLGVLNDDFAMEVTKTEITEIPEVELKNKDLNKDLNNDLNKDKNDLNIEEVKIEGVCICNNCNCTDSDCKCNENYCSICTKTFDTKSKLKRHKLTHDANRPRPFVCNICLKGYYTRSVLDNHMGTHSGLRAFSCDQCTSTFATKFNLTNHKYRWHPKRDLNGKGTLESEFRCGVCLKVFNTMYKLNVHIATHYKSNISCEKCGLSFKSKKFLHSHLRRLHNEIVPSDIKRIRPGMNLKCEYCGRVFPSDSLLKLHIRSHTGERPHKCDQCDKGFRLPSTLKIHKQAVHSNEKAYTCRSCDKKFSTRATLQGHIKTTHVANTIPKNHKCTICGKAFYTLSRLLMHVKWHTNDRQFNCDLCEKSFVVKDSLKKHRETHFKRKYKCDKCGNDFRLKSKLIEHMKVHKRVE